MKRVPISVRPRPPPPRSAIDYSNRQCDSSGSHSQNQNIFSAHLGYSKLFFMQVAICEKGTRSRNFFDTEMHAWFPVGQSSLCGPSVRRPSPMSFALVRFRTAFKSINFVHLRSPLSPRSVKLRLENGRKT